MKSMNVQLMFTLIVFVLSIGKSTSQEHNAFCKRNWQQYHDDWEPDHAVSPFFNRQKQIARNVHFLLINNKQKEALDIIKKVIDLEKVWRLQVCDKYFGRTACEFGIRTTPFDMLKVVAVNYLRRDPTDEIIGHLRSSVGQLLEKTPFHH